MKLRGGAFARSTGLLTAMALSIGADAAGAENAARGKEVFRQRCLICHSAEPSDEGGAQGPGLQGVLGRHSASAQGFPYSKALRASNLTWDAATLDRFLAAPTQLVPGTSMPINTTDAEDRRDLIAYFGALTGAEPRQAPAAAQTSESTQDKSVLLGDWRTDAPGVRRHITLAVLPAPYATPSVRNGSNVVNRPPGANLSVPKGFTVKPYTTELEGPRAIRVAPNGDVFISEPDTGRIRALRAPDGAAAPSQTTIFASGLDRPFGIAFYPPGANAKWVYVSNNNSVVRFPYQSGDLQARGPAQVIVPKLSDSTGGHTTRDIAFSNDGRRMFVSVGSGSNVAEAEARKSREDIRRWEAEHGLGAAWGGETNRAAVLVFDPEGKTPGRVFASGIRNCVGLNVHPMTGDLWCSTNERDGLGDHLVPDYSTRVREGAFYGWPWYYLGASEDPRHKGERPDLAGKITVPDVLYQSHSAALTMVFYPKISGPAAFPAEYQGHAFVALHGSWNRARRTGYKVARVPLNNGIPSGEYEDFLTGFVVDDASVWGRPVGVGVAHDGALLISDDGGSVVWRVAYTGGR